MAESGGESLRERNRQAARHAVLDAAERLLRSGESAEFSMRQLAAEASVGFATPFNHFGSKNAIMQALSARLIDRTAARFAEERPDGDAIDRVLAMGRIATALLVEQPEVSKAVVGSLGVASTVPSAVRAHSQRLWELALGDFGGIDGQAVELARAVLAEQLAFSFRGCVSFWIAGEIENTDLAPTFRTGASVVLLGFAAPERRDYLLAEIAKRHAAPRI